jgi:hypothetical protein
MGVLPGPIVQRAVQPHGLIVLSSPFDDGLGLPESVEELAIQELILQLHVTGLAVAILPVVSGLDEQGRVPVS